MMKPKILYLIWSLDRGGAEQVVMNLALHLDRSRFEPVIVCLNEKGRLAPQVESQGIRVLSLGKSARVDFLFLNKLIRCLHDEKPALIHTHLFTSNLWGRVAAWLAGIPVICTEHNMDTWKRPLHFWIDRLLLKATRKMIFVSQKVKDFYLAKLPAIAGQDVVIYNGIDVNRFSPELSNFHEIKDEAEVHFHLHSSVKTLKAKQSLYVKGAQRAQAAAQKKDKRVFMAGIVGRFVPQKGHKDFLTALSQIHNENPHVAGLLVGEGELRDELMMQAEAMGLKDSLLFTGFMEDMAKVYPLMDLFVLCSYREGFPMTILEAMAAGIPVVATRVGGVEECVTHEVTGLLLDAGRPEQLTEAVLRLVNDESLRRQLVQNAKQLVSKQFSVQNMARMHEKVYEEIIG